MSPPSQLPIVAINRHINKGYLLRIKILNTISEFIGKIVAARKLAKKSGCAIFTELTKK